MIIPHSIQRTAFIIALILFCLVGLFAMSGCQTYQPPGQGLWRALPSNQTEK